MICQQSLKRVTRTHLKKHNITTDEYKSLFPDAPIVSEALSYKLGEGSRNIDDERRAIVSKQLSEANKGRPKSAEHRAKLAAARTGVSWGSHTEEHKLKVSERAKLMWEEHRKSGWKAPPQSAEARERTRLGIIKIRKEKYWRGPANKGKKLNLSDEQRANRSRKATANMNGKAQQDTSLERLFETFLLEHAIIYTKQHVLDWSRGAFSYDFLLTDQNLLVEVDGEYWHSSGKAINRDRIKEKVAREQGYSFVRISSLDWKPEIIFAEPAARDAHSAAIMAEREVLLTIQSDHR